MGEVSIGDFVGWVLASLGLVVTIMAKVVSSQGGRIQAVDAKHDVLQKDVTDAKLYSARNYATKDELKTTQDAIIQRLDKIYDKLDTKADK